MIKFKEENSFQITKILKLNYTKSDFFRVEDYIKKSKYKNYSIVFLDSWSNKKMLLKNRVEDIQDDIIPILNLLHKKERTCVNWIGIDKATKSYVISIDFTMNHYKLPSTYIYKKDIYKLVKINIK